jgi:hypothetical protein
MMNVKRLIISLLIGFAFAVLAGFVFGDHVHPRHVGTGLEYLGGVVSVISLPGLFTDIALSNNVHGGNVVFIILGNFLFYFGITYFILWIWGKRSAKTRRLP